MKIFSFVGNSNSGKTTIITKIISELKRKNYSVGAVKHSANGFGIDKKGKDSFRLREVGADPLLLVSNSSIVLFRDNNDDNPMGVIERYFSEKDFVIIEGGKSWKGIEKIEVLGDGEKRLHLDEKPIAVISDREIVADVPLFQRNEIEKIVNFMLKIQELE